MSNLGSIQLEGRSQRNNFGREVVRLQESANKLAGNPALILHNPMFVFNPDPSNIRLAWSNFEKIERRKAWGYEVVPAERALKFFKVPARDINRTENRAERAGQVLMEVRLEHYVALKDHWQLKAIRTGNKDTEEWMRAAGVETRDIAEDKRLKRLNDSAGENRRRKLGHLTPDQIQALKSQRLMDQIKKDEERQQFVRAYGAGDLPDESYDPNVPDPDGAVRPHGVREIMLTDNPEVSLDAFE